MPLGTGNAESLQDIVDRAQFLIGAEGTGCEIISPVNERFVSISISRGCVAPGDLGLEKQDPDASPLFDRRAVVITHSFGVDGEHGQYKGVTAPPKHPFVEPTTSSIYSVVQGAGGFLLAYRNRPDPSDRQTQDFGYYRLHAKAAERLIESQAVIALEALYASFQAARDARRSSLARYILYPDVRDGTENSQGT